MQIRDLTGEEIERVYQETAGSILEGFPFVNDFSKIRERVQRGEIIFAGAYQEGDGSQELFGLGAITSSGEIFGIYVREMHRHHGVGTALLDALCRMCQGRFSVMRMNVEAPSHLIPLFQRSGFVCCGSLQEREGRSWVSMERIMPLVAEEPSAKKTSKGTIGVIIGICVVVLILLVIIVLLGGRLLGELGKNQREQAHQNPGYHKQEKYDWEERHTPSLDEAGDSKQTDRSSEDELADIEVYEAPVSYAVRTENYEEKSEETKLSVDFDIEYPQVEGLPSGKDQEVNQILRDAAMSSADLFYLQPAEEVQEFFNSQENLYLASEVDYKVTYIDENLLSVVFTDHYFLGSMYLEYSDLRARIINLETAEQYEIEDLMVSSPELIRRWRMGILDQNPDSYPGKELEDHVYERMLTGEIVDGRYFANLFLDKNGVWIGFTYAFQSDDGQRIERGWTTVPFAWKEFAPYESDHKMWDILKK